MSSTDLIVIRQKGEVLYSTGTPPSLFPLTLDGAKAVNIRCDCGALAKGLSGWVEQTLKMRVICELCQKDFYIERQIGRTELDLYMTQHDCQKAIENQFIRKYQERLEYTPEKKMGTLLEFKRKKPKVIELKEEPDESA